MNAGQSSPNSKLRIVPVTTPDGEQRDHHLRPAPRERPVERVAGAEVERLDEEHERREGDPEADERDVHGERQRLHLPRLEQVVLVDGGRSGGGERSAFTSALRIRDGAAHA